MDCVEGKKGTGKAALLVLSERKRREQIIMRDMTQESVIGVLDALERKYGRRFKEKFKTITVDNGSKFLNFKGIP